MRSYNAIPLSCVRKNGKDYPRIAGNFGLAKAAEETESAH